MEKKIGNLRVNTDDNTVENYYSPTMWLFPLSKLADDLDILRTFESLVLCTSSAYLTKYFTYVTPNRLIGYKYYYWAERQLFKLYSVPYIGCAHVPSYSPSA